MKYDHGLSLFYALCLILTSCGANTYEECVLDSIEDAKTPYAANLVKESCRAKHPILVNVQQEDGIIKQVDADKFFIQTVIKVNIGDKNNQFDKVKIQEIEPSEYDGSSNLEVTNYSDWNIKGISLGVLSNTDNLSCPIDTKDYSRFVSCTTQSSARIEKNSTKPLYCNAAINGEPYCLVTIHLE